MYKKPQHCLFIDNAAVYYIFRISALYVSYMVTFVNTHLYGIYSPED